MGDKKTIRNPGIFIILVICEFRMKEIVERVDLGVLCRAGRGSNHPSRVVLVFHGGRNQVESTDLAQASVHEEYYSVDENEGGLMSFSLTKCLLMELETHGMYVWICPFA